MRRGPFVSFALAFFLAGAFSAPAQATPLYDEFSRKAEVKIFVAAPTDASEKKALDPSVLKQALEKAFTERKSIHFKVVPSEAEATLVLETEVKGFLFTEHDPVDMLVGAGAAAMDAATIDHYCSSEALFTVREAKSGKVLWKDTVRGSITDHAMTEAESREKIGPRLGEMLMRAAFSKK